MALGPSVGPEVTASSCARGSAGWILGDNFISGREVMCWHSCTGTAGVHGGVQCEMWHRGMWARWGGLGWTG